MKFLTRLLTLLTTRSAGFAYTNMARLFLRLFVGVMFLQFGVRHLVHFEELRNSFPTILDLTPETCLITMILIELLCSLLIMVGFLTRLAVLPPIASMIAAEYYILHDFVPHLSVYGLSSTDPGYLPLMFIGIYVFILLAGPGKISLDYFVSIVMLARQNMDEKQELEEV